MGKCRHLSISDEAYCNAEPAPAFLCGWPVKLGVVPGWVNRQIGGGLMINHKTECQNCPCFEREVAK